jgi:hypothetical protein
MEKKRGPVLIFLLCIITVLVAGCTSPGSGPSAVTTPAPAATAEVTTPQIITTPSPQMNATPAMTMPSTPGLLGPSTVVPISGNSTIIIDDMVSLIAGERTSAKIYSFKELGLEFLKPNDTFIISIDSEKPIVLLVTDETGKGRFYGVSPLWEKQPPSKTTNTRMYGYSYPGIWYILKADEVYHKELLLKIDSAGSYYLIFDPQNIIEQVSELGIWQVTHKSFNARILLRQISDSQPADILPKSPYILNETPAIYSAYRDGFKEFPLEDFGLEYLHSGDTFRLSVDAEKPVNVFVVGYNDEKKFGSTHPVYELQPVKGDKEPEYGYTYAGITPLVKEDKVIRKDITFTVKETGKYFIIIDQRYSDPSAREIYFFKANVKLYQV